MESERGKARTRNKCIDIKTNGLTFKSPLFCICVIPHRGMLTDLRALSQGVLGWDLNVEETENKTVNFLMLPLTLLSGPCKMAVLLTEGPFLVWGTNLSTL